MNQHPSSEEMAARLARSLRQIPEDLLDAVARPFSEALETAWTACGRPDTRAWDGIVGPVPAAPGLVVDIHPDLEAPFSNKSPHSRFQGHIDFMTTARSVLRVDFVRPPGDPRLVVSEPQEVTDEALLRCMPVALVAQIEPALRAARHYATRLERLMTRMHHLYHLHPEDIDRYELCIFGAFQPGGVEHTRDVVRHPRRQTFLLREREADHPPHRIEEFDDLEAALDAAQSQFARTHLMNVDPTFLRRKAPPNVEHDAAKLADLRAAIDAGDASGVFDGNAFDHARATMEVTTKKKRKGVPPVG